MPRGTDTYRGLGLPQEGNVNLKAVSTADVFTVTQSSGGGGNFLVLRNRSTAAGGNVADSTLLTADKIRFSSLPAIQFTSNTSVVQTISTAGIVGGQESTLQAWGIDSSGRMIGNKINVISLTSASTVARTLASSESGSLIVASSVGGTLTNVLLPASSVAPIGTYYDFLVRLVTTVTDFSISATAGVTAGHLVLEGLADTTVSTASAIAPLTTYGAAARVVLGSSLNWYVLPHMYLVSTGPNSSGEVSTADFTGWQAGTTVA